MSDDKLHDALIRASQARDLLSNELLSEAFDELEKAYVNFWRTTKVDDDKGREKLFIAVNVVGKVKAHLQNVLSDGSIAKRELDELIARPKKEWAQV